MVNEYLGTQNKTQVDGAAAFILVTIYFNTRT